jgi:hypothetical protein
MMPVAPCRTCGQDTNRWCGTFPCCWECHWKLTPAHVMQRGKPGRARADHGPYQYDLMCVTCGATWVGPAWETCDWCRWASEKPIQPPPIEYVAGVLECDQCGAIRKTNANWYELAVHGAAEVTAGHPEHRACNGWMRRIPIGTAARIAQEHT